MNTPISIFGIFTGFLNSFSLPLRRIYKNIEKKGVISMEWELLGIVLVSLYGLIAYIFRFPTSIPYSISRENRDGRLDQMRGIAMIGIVCIHIHSYFEFFHPTDFNITTWTLFFSNLSRFSVPVFIFGSSLYLNKKDDYWRSKFKSLLLPYTIACIIGYLIKYQTYSIPDFVIRFLTGSIFAPYYFVPLLFQFYIIYYFLPERILTDSNLIILLALSIIVNLLSNFNVFNNLFPEWYAPLSVFNFLFFFFLGLFLKKFSISNSSKIRLQFESQIFLFLASIVLLFIFSLKNINLKNHHLVYPLLSILILNHILPISAENYFSKSLGFIGKNSLYIFLLHPFVIHQMHAFDPYLLFNPYIGYLLTLILNVGIPGGFAYFITYQLRTSSNR